MKDTKKMNRFKTALVSILLTVRGTRAAFADAADPGIIDVIESDSDVQIILIAAVVVIIIAIILLRRSIKKRRAKAEKDSLR